MKANALRLVAALLFGGLLGSGASAEPPNQPKTAKAKPAVPKGFLIVAPESFHGALTEYVEYKRKIRPTTLVSLEHVLSTNEGCDDPERLKRFLYEAWRRQQLGYVLLVGDVDVMPMRYMVLDRVTPAAFDYAFYPSDLYYADLAKRDGRFDDWNAIKMGFHRGYFGEVRGEKNKRDPINYDQIDYRPEIACGRWPVSNVNEVGVVAAKTIAYEQSVRTGTHAGMRHVDFFNTAGYVDVRDRMSTWARQMPAGWSAGRYFSLMTRSPTARRRRTKRM